MHTPHEEKTLSKGRFVGILEGKRYAISCQLVVEVYVEIVFNILAFAFFRSFLPRCMK